MPWSSFPQSPVPRIQIMTNKNGVPFRSTRWFGLQDKDGFIHRSWMKNQGFPANLFDGRPVIGICNTWSELVPCNAHFRLVADRVKRGIYEAGGFPLEFPVMSLGETNLRPTAMLFRNLVSMDVEESIRGNPLDGVVLLCGCDKTTPSLMMGAASCDLPALVVSGGGILHVALGWSLHDHGHSVYDGVHGRGFGHGNAAECGDPGGRFAPLRPGTRGGKAHRGDGSRKCEDVANPDPEGI